MQTYELLYIIPAKYSEEEIKLTIKKLDEYLSQKKCDILKSENWGEKKLAYPIKQSRYGHYILREFTAEKETIKEINNFLALSEEIIRYLIIKATPIKIKITKAKIRKISEEKISPTEKTVPKETSKKEEKISLDNLDQKLEEILQEKII